MGVWWWGPRRRRPQIRNFIIENEVPDLGHGRVGCWGPCLDEVVGFVFGFIILVLYVGGSGWRWSSTVVSLLNLFLIVVVLGLHGRSFGWGGACGVLARGLAECFLHGLSSRRI